MVKSDFSPTISAWRRRIFTPIEWKVPSHGMPSTTPPTISPTRCFISRAALLVKVTARISLGPGAAGGEDVGDAHGEHAGLAGAGAGQHQHRAVERLDRQPLFRIEPGEIGRAAAAACARAAMPPGAGAGGSTGSMLRFRGSAKAAVPIATDSHGQKMALGRGFYEACRRHSGAQRRRSSPESR